MVSSVWLSVRAKPTKPTQLHLIVLSKILMYTKVRYLEMRRRLPGVVEDVDPTGTAGGLGLPGSERLLGDRLLTREVGIGQLEKASVPVR